MISVALFTSVFDVVFGRLFGTLRVMSVSRLRQTVFIHACRSAHIARRLRPLPTAALRDAVGSWRMNGSGFSMISDFGNRVTAEILKAGNR
jgi:hypothetical protein